MKPTKRIAIVDAGRTPDIVHAVLPFIEERYNLEITDDRDADYVFHSCLGHEVLKYSGIRIFVTGECVSPDFNISDYALAFDPIDFGDRYIRLPLIRLFTEAYESLCAPSRTGTDLGQEERLLCICHVEHQEQRTGAGRTL